jgi:hypothetical protein
MRAQRAGLDRHRRVGEAQRQDALELHRPSKTSAAFVQPVYDAVVEQRRRLKHLRKLALRRYGCNWTPPNDVHGRNMLLAMLACGLTGPDAHKLARWVTPQQLQDMISTAESREWDPDDLGNLVELLDEEREADKLWSMRPCDRDWPDVQARRHERKKVYDAEYARRSYAEKKENITMNKYLSVREEAIYDFLLHAGGKWTVKRLVAQFADHPAFRRPDGPQLTGGSLRSSIRVELDRLKERGALEEVRMPTVNGLFERVFRWKSGDGLRRKRTQPATARRTDATTNASYARTDIDKMGTSRMFDPPSIRSRTLSFSSTIANETRPPMGQTASVQQRHRMRQAPL